MLAWQQIVSNLPPLFHIQEVLIGERFGSRRSTRQKRRQEPMWTERRHLALPQTPHSQALLRGFQPTPSLSTPKSQTDHLGGEVIK